MSLPSDAARHPLQACFSRIQSTGGSVHGAGFLVADRLVCTCAHVLNFAVGRSADAQPKPVGAVNVVFPYSGEQLVPATVEVWRPLDSAPPADVALLRLEQDPPSSVSLPRPIGPASMLDGHRYDTFGVPPDTRVGIYANGRLGKVRPDDTVQMQRDAGGGMSIGKGFSGAPVWDADELGVAGMVVTHWTDASVGAAFLIPYDALASAAGPGVLPERSEQRFSGLTTGVRVRRNSLERFLTFHLGRNGDAVELVGREAELDALDDWLADPEPFALIVEPAGRGKSSLLAHWALRTTTSGRAVVTFAPISLAFNTQLRDDVLSLAIERMRYLHGGLSSGQRIADTELETHLRTAHDPMRPLVLIVDGGDEAERWHPADLPIPLERIRGVKVLLSARQEYSNDFMDWMRRLGWDRLATRVPISPLTSDAIGQLVDPDGRAGLSRASLDRLEQTTGGEPAIVSLYAGGSAPAQIDLKASPVQTWWHFQEAEFEAASGGPIGSSDELRRLVAVLAEAHGPLARDDLAQLAGLTSGAHIKKLAALGRWVTEVGDEQARGSGGLAFSHPELGRFFRDDMLVSERRELNSRLLTFCRNALAERRAGSEPTAASAYALAHLPAHLSGARDAAGPSHDVAAEDLAAVVADPWYQETYIGDLRDVAALRSELDGTLATLVASPAATLSHIARVALSIWEFRTVRMRPEAVFALAEEGDVAGAEQRLALFDADERWRRAAGAAIAWMAIEHAHLAGQQLLDRVRATAVDVPPLPLLLARIEAQAEGKPEPQLEPLPPPPDGWGARVIVESVDGVTDPAQLEYGSEHERMRGVSHDADAEAVLVATIDGPRLVSYAVAEPAVGRELLDRYIIAHFGNPYQEYRDSSLWELLAAVLRHPNRGQARDLTRTLATGALAAAGMPYTGALPTATDALLVDTEPQLIAERRTTVASALAQLSGPPGETDLWSHHRRALAACAEAMSVVLGDQAVAADLLAQALDLPYGFSGYLTTAALTTAEAFRVCALPVPGNRRPPLDVALAMAHNIREPGFCARATARVNAMRADLPGQDVGDRVERFAAGPLAAEFAPIHKIGELYGERVPYGRAPLPEAMLTAASLTALGQVYRTSLAGFQRLNPTWTANKTIHEGEIRVPDAGFTPLMAARLAADVLAAPGLAGLERAGLIRKLVPEAAGNRTALDTVLARLTLADPPRGTALSELRTLTEGSGA